MAISLSIIIAGAVVLSLFVMFPILIGVYVYKDAKRRRMNAALWVLVTVLAPAFIGLIIYLLARGSYSDLSCPSCAAPVTEQFTVCPQCGARFKRTCPRCGMPAEEMWQVCPGCAEPLLPAEGLTPPLKQKDKGLRRILIAVLLIPLGFILLFLFFGINSYGGGRVGSMGAGSYTPADYAHSTQVTEWLAACDPAFDGLHVLHWETSAGETVKSSYLIYDPSAAENRNIRLGEEGGLFGKKLMVRMDTSDLQEEPVYTLTYITNTSNYPVGLKVFVDGKEKDCMVTTIEFNPSLLLQ